MAIGDLYQTDLWFQFQGDTQNIYTYYLLETASPPVVTSEEEINGYMGLTFVPAMNTGDGSL